MSLALSPFGASLALWRIDCVLPSPELAGLDEGRDEVQTAMADRFDLLREVFGHIHSYSLRL